MGMDVSEIESVLESMSEYTTVKSIEVHPETNLAFADVRSLTREVTECYENLPAEWYAQVPGDDAEPLAEGTQIRLAFIFRDDITESPDYFCEAHELVEPHYKGTQDEHCAYCREERAIESQRMHMLTRDTRVEPW